MRKPLTMCSSEARKAEAGYFEWLALVFREVFSCLWMRLPELAAPVLGFLINLLACLLFPVTFPALAAYLMVSARRRAARRKRRKSDDS